MARSHTYTYTYIYTYTYRYTDTDTDTDTDITTCAAIARALSVWGCDVFALAYVPYLHRKRVRLYRKRVRCFRVLQRVPVCCNVLRRGLWAAGSSEVMRLHGQDFEARKCTVAAGLA